MVPEETRLEGVYWIQRAFDRVQWWSGLNRLMNLPALGRVQLRAIANRVINFRAP